MPAVPEIPIDSFEIFARGLDHPECIAFDRDGNLWAGGEAGQIYRIDSSGTVTLIANVGHFCAGLAFSPRDELFVCVADVGIVRVERDGGYSVFADRAADHTIVYPNFPLFDAEGSLYATDSGNWKQRNGYVLRWTPEGKGQIVAGPYGYTNGLALTADGRSLFMVESDTDSVHLFDVREDGSLSNGRIFARDVGRLPDGLALDADGNLYVACYASDEIHRIDPSGRMHLVATDRYAILLGGPTNLAFGGADFDHILVANLARQTITRARLGRPGQRLANQRTR